VQSEDSDLSILAMSEADIPFANRLTDIEEWGYLPDDFRRLISLQPSGCFVAWKGGERAGMITCMLYGDYAFLGSLIVLAACRQKNIGEQLMRHAMSYLEGEGARTIELDGVFPAVSLYRRLGFVDKYLSLRFYRPPGAAAGSASAPKTGHSDSLVEFDLRKTGVKREHLLRRYCREFGQSAYAVGDTELSAYAIVRPTSDDRFTVAPFVAQDTDSAGQLLSAVVAKYAAKGLGMGVPEVNRDMVALLLREGFTYTQPSVRMYRGPRRDYERHVYGIASPDKG